MSNSLWSHGLQHFRLPCPSLSPGVCSNSCPLSQWCHPTISSSVALFFGLQSFASSRSFPMSQLLASGSHSIGASASASVLPMNIQGLFPLGWTGFISLLSFSCSFATWVDGDPSLWLLRPTSLRYSWHFSFTHTHIQSSRRFCWLSMADSITFHPIIQFLSWCAPPCRIKYPHFVEFRHSHMTCFNWINVDRTDGYDFQRLL